MAASGTPMLRNRKVEQMPLPPAPPREADAVLPGGILSLAELRDPDRYRAERACRAAAQVAYLGDHTVLSRVLGRYKVYLDTRDRGFAAHLMLDGYWEMWLTQFIARLVEPGMTVVDVGANFGYYSLLMADLIGPAGHLLAVEPNPAAVTMLTRSLELNGFARRSAVISAAAGVREGIGRLFIPDGEPKNAMLVDDGAEAVGRASIAVPVRPLDALLSNTARVDFLKIDAEGAEEEVIAGLSETIARCRPRIVLEFNPGRCRDPQALLAWLRAFYPVLRVLNFDAEVVPAGDAKLLDPTDHEDRLIFLEPAFPA